MISTNPRNTGHTSYQYFGWSPAELDTAEEKTLEVLQALAKEDGYEAYDDLLPFGDWDYLEGEEPSDTWRDAIVSLMEADGYSLYNGADEAGPLTIELAKKLQRDNSQRVIAESVKAITALASLIDNIAVPDLKERLEKIINSDRYYRYTEQESFQNAA